jgi:hypothetical protein
MPGVKSLSHHQALRPFRNRISICAPPGASGAAATFTSTKRLAPSHFAPELSPSRFFHQ